MLGGGGFIYFLIFHIFLDFYKHYENFRNLRGVSDIFLGGYENIWNYKKNLRGAAKKLEFRKVAPVSLSCLGVGDF